MSRILLALAIILLAFALPASAQVQNGTPPLGSFGGGPDVINLANLNSHLVIPVLHRPGRGTNFTYDLTYDSSVWYPSTSGGTNTWTPVYNWGWIGQTQTATGYLSYNYGFGGRCSGSGGSQYFDRGQYSGFTYNDAYGTLHKFPGFINFVSPPCTPAFGGSLNVTATDGSGYNLQVTVDQTGNITSLQVYSSSGTQLNPPQQLGSGPGTFTDRNGNKITVDGSGHFYDTLSSTTPVLTVAGVPPSNTTFTYTAPSSAPAPYTMSYVTYTVATNFAVSGINEHGAIAVNLVDKVTLPDGSFYQFSYEPTPSIPSNHACTPLSGTYANNCVTARVAKITLPTGGYISYLYSGGAGTNGSGIFADGSTATLQRAVYDGSNSNSWTYAQVKGTGAASTTSITDPAGNQTNMNFQGIYETQRLVYQGSVSPSNLLETVNTCYNSSTSPCTSTAITLPITQRSVAPQFPSGIEAIYIYNYNSAGGLTSELDHDYGPGGSTPLIRETDVTFAPLGNITAFRKQVTVKNGSGTVVSQTNYNYDETGVVAPPNQPTPQHISVTGSRGNLTSIVYPVSGLKATFTNYDTGQVQTSTDVNGAQTIYNYGALTATCGNAFPTSVSEPLNMSRSMTWNCSGSVPITVTDENSKVTTYTWNDPDFWRPASISFPDGGQTSWTYNSQTNTTTTTKMNSSQNIVTKQLLDGLGRNKEQQLYSDPEGVVYTDTTHDTLGRVYTVSNPYRSTSDPTYGLTTYGYDALSRPKFVTLQDGSVASASYTNNTITATGPAGITRTSTYDSLHRLTQVLEDPGSSPHLSFETDYSYDALGDLLCVGQKGTNSGTFSGCSSIPAAWRARTYAYDAMSRLTSQTNPESGTVTYGYDASGHQGDLTSRVAPAPNQTGSTTVTTTYSYDLLHRLTQKSYSDGTTAAANFVYDQTANWFSLTNTTGRMTEAYSQIPGLVGTVFSYDAMGRVIINNQCDPAECPSGGLGLTYSYDLAGNTTSYTNGVGVTFTQSMDTASRPTGLTSNYVDSQHPATLLTVDSSAGYYPHGALRKMTFGNGLTQSTEIESRLQPCEINLNSSGSMLTACGAAPSGTIQDHHYGFGSWGSTNNGDVTAWIASGTQNFNRSYSYDSLNRLSTLSSPSDPNGCTGLSWIYDAWGNRTDQTNTGSCPSFHQSVNTQNQLVDPINHVYQYDSAGNLTADGNHTYTYDGENRLTQVDGGNTAAYIYDALGRRVEKTTGATKHDYIYDLSGHVVAEWCTNCSGYTGWSFGYVYFDRALTAEYGGSTYFVHPDHLGSTRLLTGVGSDLVSNPGFESGLSGWTTSGNVAAITDSTRAHSGNGYVQVTANPSTGPAAFSAYLPVNVGDQISFGGWTYRESGVGGNAYWLVEAEDSNKNALYWAGPNPSTVTAAAWTFQAGTYTVPAGIAYVRLLCQVYLPTSTSVARFDDGFLYNNRTSLQVFQSLDYLPFGELNSADSGISTHKFTGDEHDSETNLEHTQFRKYSSALGRWLSPDPAGIGAVDPRNPQSWNRYSYVLNNPLKFVDPRGLYCEFFDDSGNNVESIDAYSSPDECGSNGGTWVDDNTTVLVNANDPNNPDSLGGPGSGLPPAGCSFFYQNGTLDGTLCGNQFSPAELPLTSQDYLVAIHNQLSKLPTVCGGVAIFGSAEIGGFGGFAQVDQNGNASATSLIPVAPGITNNVQSSGNGPLLFYGEGAGVLYEPDLGNYGAPAAVGGYLGFSIPGTKTEAAIGAYVENPSIAGAYSCPP